MSDKRQIIPTFFYFQGLRLTHYIIDHEQNFWNMLEKEKKLSPQFFMRNSQRNAFLLINVLCFARLNEFVYFKPNHFSGSIWQTSGGKIYLY